MSNRRRPSCTAGFSLVEMLIALTLSAVLLAGAWSWVWAVTSAGARAADQVEARTSLAFARRVLLNDARVATGLATDRPSSASSLSLAVPSWHQADGSVYVSWDHRRAVLWRLAPGCHLSDGVELFHIAYFDAGGGEIDCGAGALSPATAEAVRGIAIAVRLRAGDAVVRGRWTVWFARGLR